MPKRSKNSTDGAVFTYHERQVMDHGSIRRRLPGDAMKPWDRCALGLSRPKDPVITPEGVLYEREAILRDLLRQREDARREQAEAVADHIREEGEEQRKKKAEERAVIERFEKAQSDVLPSAQEESGKKDERTRVAAAPDSNFWLPSIPDGLPSSRGKRKGSTKKDKISLKTRCPISKKPLRSKDLISLKLTPNKLGKQGEGSEGAKVDAAEKYVCPVCQSVLVNAVKPIALRTGTVLCSRCVAQFVMTEGTDPCTSDNIDVKHDIIPIFNVGTAFAASAADDPSSHEASVYRPSAR